MIDDATAGLGHHRGPAGRCAAARGMRGKRKLFRVIGPGVLRVELDWVTKEGNRRDWATKHYA